MEVYPATVPDLYVGEPVMVSARLPQGLDGDLSVAGNAQDAAWERTASLANRRDAAGVAALCRLDKADRAVLQFDQLVFVEHWPQ